MRAVVLALLAAVSGGCSRERAAGDGPSCPTWREDVGPALATACAGCHEGATAAGGYDVSTYAKAIAGDARTELLAVLDPTTADAPHQGFATLRTLLARWTNDCALAYFSDPIHAKGIQDPQSGDFHGTLVKDLGWDFPRCATCHGNDFSGGTSGASCRTCHEGGPTACTTCHGSPPDTGAHVAHLGKQPLAKPYACSACHTVPATWDAPGHLDGAAGAVVTFGAMAALTPAGAQRSGPPSFDPTTKTCTNVYCHGGTMNDAAAAHPAPVWTGGASQTAGCGGCHGDPPASHGTATQCQTCHPHVAVASDTLASTALHVDGAIDVGDGSGGCTACHGGPAGPAPPRDLAGETTTSALGVGAHQAHLQAPHALTAPIACATCHVVPAQVMSPGHIDSDPPAEVILPAGAWDRSSATCAASCHGATSPAWTSPPDSGQVFCGSCHGVPPANANHIATWTLSTCVTCHAETVDAFGDPIVTGPPGAQTSKHMNGVIDHAP